MKAPLAALFSFLLFTTGLAAQTCTAASQSGHDFGEKVHACIQSLGGGGGTVDATGLTGTQTVSADPFQGSHGHITLQVGNSTVTSVATWALPSDTKIIGKGPDASKLIFDGGQKALPTAITMKDSQNVEITGVELNGQGSGKGTYIGVDFSRSRHFKIGNSRIRSFGKTSPWDTVSGMWANTFEDAWIENNEFTDNGPVPVIKNAFDIVTGFSGPSVNGGLHINHNRMHDSHAAITISLFDTHRSEIKDNTIDENNNLSEITGSIQAISRKDNIVTVKTDDTSHVYNGRNNGSTVRISGTSQPTLNIVTAPVAVFVDDANTFHFKQNVTGDDVSLGGGGKWVAGANNSGYGILCYTTVQANKETASYENTITGNHITNTAGPGILLQGSPRSTVEDNVVTNANRQNVSGSHPQGCIALNAGNVGAPFGEKTVVRRNTLSNCGEQGIDVVHSLNSIVSQNKITNVANVGIRLRDGEDGITVTDNAISGARNCIYADSGLKQAKIEQNTCSSFGGQNGAGIFIMGAASSVTVTGNELSAGVSSIPITSLRRHNGVVTVKTQGFHHLAANARIEIAGTGRFDGAFQVLDTPDNDEFQYQQAGGDASGSGGSVNFPGSPRGIAVFNQNAGDITIDDNTMESAGTVGIDYRGKRGHISGNTIRKADTVGILLTNAEDTAVDSNAIVGTGTYGIDATGGSNTLTKNVVLANKTAPIHAAGVRCDSNIVDMNGTTHSGDNCGGTSQLSSALKGTGAAGAKFSTSGQQLTCDANNVRQIWIVQDTSEVRRCSKSKNGGYTWIQIH